MAVSHTAYDEVPAHDVVSLTWWLWFIQCFVYLALVEFATALAWVQFAQDKQRARLHNTVSLIYFYVLVILAFVGIARWLLFWQKRHVPQLRNGVHNSVAQINWSD
mgnify:CR=1 FL=1